MEQLIISLALLAAVVAAAVGWQVRTNAQRRDDGKGGAA